MSCVYKGVTSTFKYGADGLRRQATVNGVVTDYAYDGQTLVQEGFASGGTLSTVKATYLQGPRGSECRIDETQQTEGYYRFDAGGVVIKNASGQPQVFGRGVTKWYVYDGLGSVVGEVDVNGNLTSSPKYDVYGLVRANPGTASSAMGFVGGLGHLSEAGTGLIYMRARYYDPAPGRFVSQDPSKNGLNWFIYCNNNPVCFSDNTGKAPGDWVMLGDGLLTLGFQAALLCQFLLAIRSTNDSGEVEEDWGKFCEAYGKADPLFGDNNKYGTEENIGISLYLGVSGAVEGGSLAGGMMTVAGGATAGASMAIMIYGYEARVDWYANRCDGD